MKADAPPQVPRALQLGALLSLVAGAALRCWTSSPLWLDESLTVNIARLPLDQLHAALRQDGAPPLFYLLLHGWIRLFGSGDVSVRVLPGLLGLLVLPLAFACGRRVAGAEGAWAALLLLASSPFAVRYATECRMYSLVLLLVAAGFLVVHRALESPTLLRLAPVSLVTGALLYTHYWALFLLAVVAAVLLATWTPASRRCVGALAAGGLLLVPWLPTFSFQAAHTGAPWAAPAGYDAVPGAVVEWSGGGSAQGLVLSWLLGALVVAGLVGRRRGARQMVLELAAARLPLALLVTAAGTLLVGVTAGLVSGSAYAGRYSTVALLPLLLLAARGVTALPSAAVAPVLAVAVGCGLLGAAHNPGTARTDADVVARAIDREAAPGDLVVYCPDQLGPAVSRYLRSPLQQVVFPTGGPPQRIDWVDYERRNAAADPVAFARRVSAQAGTGRIWLVTATGYRTFGRSCERLAATLAATRSRHVTVPTRRSYFEHPGLMRFDAPGG